MAAFNKIPFIYATILILSAIGWFICIIGFTQSSGDAKQQWFIAMIVFINIFFGCICILCLFCVFGKCVNGEPKSFSDIIISSNPPPQIQTTQQPQQPQLQPIISSSLPSRVQQLPSLRQSSPRRPHQEVRLPPSRQPSPQRHVHFYPPLPVQQHDLRNSRELYPPGHRVCTV